MEEEPKPMEVDQEGDYNVWKQNLSLDHMKVVNDMERKGETQYSILTKFIQSMQQHGAAAADAAAAQTEINKAIQVLKILAPPDRGSLSDFGTSFWPPSGKPSLTTLRVMTKKGGGGRKKKNRKSTKKKRKSFKKKRKLYKKKRKTYYKKKN